MPTIFQRAEPDLLLCFTGLAAGLGAAYESHRRAVCCYPAPQLPQRQVTPLGFIPVTRGESSGVTPALITALTDL